MKPAGLLVVAVLAGWPMAAGCNGSSAREPANPTTAAKTAETTPAASPAAEPAPAAPSAATPAPSAAASAVLPPRDASGVIEATFDDIKFPMEKTELFRREMLTPKVEAMGGQRIRIRGYMFPTPIPRGIKQFVLVRDNMECCFGPGAALFDCVLVTMTPGKTAEFSIRPIAVEGTFRVEEIPGPGGRPLVIYQMTGDAVN
jgi:hypothetical protein